MPLTPRLRVFMRPMPENCTALPGAGSGARRRRTSFRTPISICSSAVLPGHWCVRALYLYRIAANLAVDFARKTKVRLRYLSEETHAHAMQRVRLVPRPAAASAPELQRLHATLAELPPACREAFLRKRVAGLSHAEIARRFEVSYQCAPSTGTWQGPRPTCARNSE